jgi:hypothetical protein
MLTQYVHIPAVIITVPLSSYSWLNMPLCDVAVVRFVILQSSSRSGGKGMLCARIGLRSATVRGNDYHGEGWYHRLVQFRYHSGITEDLSCLEYDAMLIGKWLQAFQRGFLSPFLGLVLFSFA